MDVHLLHVNVMCYVSLNGTIASFEGVTDFLFYFLCSTLPAVGVSGTLFNTSMEE